MKQLPGEWRTLGVLLKVSKSAMFPRDQLQLDKIFLFIFFQKQERRVHCFFG